MTDSTHTNEELFCLKFELDSLAEVMIKKESERWLPNFTFNSVHHDHVKRYELALNFVKGKKVMDIACGAGRGSYMLSASGHALQVDGFDMNEATIRYANHRNKLQNINFEVQDALTLKAENEYDVIVSFETIEHVSDVDIYLQNTLRALRHDGKILISTPISAQTHNTKPENPYHSQEWGFAAFQQLIEKYYKIDALYIQLYPKKSSGIVHKLIRKLATTSINPIANYSTIEPFTGQYGVSELGTVRRGFQILVCSKK